MTSEPDIRPFERFLFGEARLLDERRFNDWLALFAADAWYWVPVQENQSSPHDTVSIVYDDRRMLEVRVRRLAQGSAHALNPLPRTSRILGNIVVDAVDEGAGEYEVSGRFQMVEFRNDSQRLYAGGVRWGLRRDGEAFRIRWKRIDLVDCDGMIEGITVPF